MPSALTAAGACAQAVAEGAVTYPEVAAMLADIRARTLGAFAAAAAEPKLTSREDLNARVSAPLAGPPSPSEKNVLPMPLAPPASGPTGQVMRKNMNSVLDELLAAHRETVYLAEDGVHGGCVCVCVCVALCVLSVAFIPIY
jgi:hypothetical protein